MKKVIKSVVLFVAFTFAASCLAGCGESDANKAYVNWVEGAGAVLSAATEQFTKDITEANAAGDLERIIEISENYLVILKENEAELDTIDQTKLTGEYKNQVPAQIDAFKEAVVQAEVNLNNAKANLEAINGETR